MLSLETDPNTALWDMGVRGIRSPIPPALSALIAEHVAKDGKYGHSFEVESLRRSEVVPQCWSKMSMSMSSDLVSEKTSISQNHAYVVLHSRFPPFGFVCQPLRSDTYVLHESWRNRV